MTGDGSMQSGGCETGDGPGHDMAHVDHDENCAACGVYERIEDSRYCEGCHDALATEQVEVEEWRCPGCGWLEPEYQAGDPALCPNCGVEYGLNPDTRVRTWPRCSGWNDDGSKCDRRTSDEYCHDHKPVATDGGIDVDRRWRITAGRWAEKGQENIDKWGQQDVDTLLLAMQEELGELTQAHLEARAEGGDASRVGEELADLAALCFQLEWRLTPAPQDTDTAQSGGAE